MITTARVQATQFFAIRNIGDMAAGTYLCCLLRFVDILVAAVCWLVGLWWFPLPLRLCLGTVGDILLRISIPSVSHAGAWRRSAVAPRLPSPFTHKAPCHRLPFPTPNHAPPHPSLIPTAHALPRIAARYQRLDVLGRAEQPVSAAFVSPRLAAPRSPTTDGSLGRRLPFPRFAPSTSSLSAYPSRFAFSGSLTVNLALSGSSCLPLCCTYSL